MSSLILFLFCLFFHGSHARYLDLHGSSYDRKAHHFGEVAEKIESIGSISSNAQSKFRPRALLGSFKTEKQVENGENNLSAVNPTKQKASNSSSSGMKEVIVSDEIDLHGANKKTKGGVMKIGREMKESRGHEAEAEADEVVDLIENGGEEEDVVVMDYAQPHRKPPIHNEKP